MESIIIYNKCFWAMHCVKSKKKKNGKAWQGDFHTTFTPISANFNIPKEKPLKVSKSIYEIILVHFE